MNRRIRLFNNFYIITLMATKTHSCWYILPTIYFIYNRYAFLETGIHTPQINIGFNFLKFSVFFELQKAY